MFGGKVKFVRCVILESKDGKYEVSQHANMHTVLSCVFGNGVGVYMLGKYSANFRSFTADFFLPLPLPFTKTVFKKLCNIKR